MVLELTEKVFYWLLCVLKYLKNYFLTWSGAQLLLVYLVLMFVVGKIFGNWIPWSRFSLQHSSAVILHKNSAKCILDFTGSLHQERPKVWWAGRGKYQRVLLQQQHCLGFWPSSASWWRFKHIGSVQRYSSSTCNKNSPNCWTKISKRCGTILLWLGSIWKKTRFWENWFKK